MVNFLPLLDFFIVKIGIIFTKKLGFMARINDKDNVANPNKCFNYKTGEWEDKPKIAKIGVKINERIYHVNTSIPIQRGVNRTVLDGIRNSYCRENISTINYKTYDDAIRSLNKSAYEVWKEIKRIAINGCNAVKLNNTIIKNLTNITDDSNASKIINNLVKSGLIFKTKNYKDLYGINVLMYFKGNYNKFATNYINSGYNIDTDYFEDYDSDEEPIEDIKTSDELDVNKLYL